MDDFEQTLYLRKKLVLGASEWLAGMNGSRENEKLKFGYTDKEWEWIWSTMIEDGAWAVPALRDTQGNYLKENFAPELMIRYAAHEMRRHIIVFDLQLNRIQFCSGNFLKDDNVIFVSPLILYATGGHFQSVFQIDHEHFSQLTNQLELENRHDSVISIDTSKEIPIRSNTTMNHNKKDKHPEDNYDEHKNRNENTRGRQSKVEENELGCRLNKLRSKSKRTFSENQEYERLRRK
jgi:hypothetical protein